MGEFLSQKLLEFKKLLYDANTFRVELLEDTEQQIRPRSEKMKLAYPELYQYLMANETERQKLKGKFPVAVMHLDSKGDLSKKLDAEKRKKSEILRTLFQKLRLSLIDVATKIKNNPSGDLGKIEYFIGTSVLGNAERSLGKMGFEIFEIDDDDPQKWEGRSQQRRQETYGPDETPKKREQKIVFISREKILKFFGKDAIK